MDEVIIRPIDPVVAAAELAARVSEIQALIEALEETKRVTQEVLNITFVV